MKILVTGFDPFGGEKTNPALEAVKRLPAVIKGAEILKLEIPTVFGKCAKIVAASIEQEHPDYVVHIGQAGGRYGITPERVAINIDDARIPDNEGNQPIDTVIQPDGENAYFSQLPIKAMVTYIHKVGLPASVSNTAGTFVCNHIMYQTLHLTNTKYPDIKAGFIHVPFLPEQVINRPNTPSMSLEDIVKGLTAAMEAIVDFHGKGDLSESGGTIH